MAPHSVMPTGSSLNFLPAFPSLMDYGGVSQIKPFLAKLLLAIVLTQQQNPLPKSCNSHAFITPVGTMCQIG